jgi:hypothetical protein
MSANAERGEVMLGSMRLRPSYAALVAAEAEIGSLFALLDRTSAGQVTLSDMIALLWYCVVDRPADVARDGFAEFCVVRGLANITPVYRTLMEAALAGA